MFARKLRLQPQLPMGLQICVDLSAGEAREEEGRIMPLLESISTTDSCGWSPRPARARACKKILSSSVESI